MDHPIYILAEGKSSRMGSDKGLVKINGKEMILHCIENLNAFKQEIIIITSNIEYEKFGHRIISDKIKNQGPAQGVITALEDCKHDKCLIVSCDMPLVNDLMIHGLDAPIAIGMKSAEICCYSESFLFPFPGVYSKSILPAWKEKVANGTLKIQSLIKQFDYKTLPIEQADLFLNVNTREDILKLSAKLKSS